MNELRIFDRSSSVEFVFDIVRLIEIKVVSLLTLIPQSALGSVC